MSNPLMKKDEKTSMVKQISDLLNQKKDALRYALPKILTPERMIRTYLTAMNRNPLLFQCTPASILQSIFTLAQLGLIPDSILGYAHLIPYKNGKKDCYEAQLIIGYRGLIELARRSGQVSDIYADIVYEKEIFEMESGIDRKLKHIKKPPEDRGVKIIGTYAVAKFKDGNKAWVWLWKSDVDKIKEKAVKGKSQTPWFDYEEEMILKTALRRLAKWLPLSSEFQKAAVIDECIEQGVELPPMSEIETGEIQLIEDKTEPEAPEQETDNEK